MTQVQASVLELPGNEARTIQRRKDEAVKLHQLAIKSSTDAVEYALTCGALLCDLKRELPHGAFGRWLETSGIPRSTATKYMRVVAAKALAENADPNCYDVAKSTEAKTIAGMLRELAAPAPSPVPSVDGEQAIKASDEWYTPVEIVDRARAALGGRIDFDPCSSVAANEVIRAARFLSLEDDALNPQTVWGGKRKQAVAAWMNPPYSDPAPFVRRLLAELEPGHIAAAIVLVNNQTDAVWFHELLAHSLAAVLTEGRIQFWAPGRPSGNNRQGQAIFGLGAIDLDTFTESFEGLGTIVGVV